MQISEITRRDIIDAIHVEKVNWCGRLEEPAFLARLFDLSSLPSTDHRFDDAAGDIWQHRINNYDWDDDWVFYDSRFNLMNGDDETFLRWVAHSLLWESPITAIASQTPHRSSVERDSSSRTCFETSLTEHGMTTSLPQADLCSKRNHWRFTHSSGELPGEANSASERSHESAYGATTRTQRAGRVVRREWPNGE